MVDWALEVCDMSSANFAIKRPLDVYSPSLLVLCLSRALIGDFPLARGKAFRQGAVHICALNKGSRRRGTRDEDVVESDRPIQRSPIEQIAFDEIHPPLKCR